MSPISSWSKNKPSKKQAKHKQKGGLLLVLFLYPEYGGDMFLRNVIDFQRTTKCYIPEDRTLTNHRCENLKSYTVSRNSVSTSQKTQRVSVIKTDRLMLLVK
jgi:hypothetical protein